jgi:hypothetical protein
MDAINIKFKNIAVFIFVSLILYSTYSSATFPGSNGVIGYSHSNGPYAFGEGLRVIRAINPDGTGERDISGYEKFQWIQGWSPDGAKYFYTNGAGILGIRNADGSGDKLLLPSCVSYAGGSFSPDGAKIVFGCGVGTWANLYIRVVPGVDPLPVKRS